MSASGGKKIIIANWKMNLSIPRTLNFIKKLAKSNNEIVIAAPYTFLCALKQRAIKVKLAGQDVSQFAKGAYTGEVSGKMLKEIGCTYCIVGHSERRIFFKETDDIINLKVLNLLKVKIKPIICIGENAQQRKKKLTKQILKKQLGAALKGIKNLRDILIAYEPVWAISTFQKGKIKHSANLQDIILTHKYIKDLLQKKYKSKELGVNLIYGGTVNPENSKDILGLKEVDGALVGGASLKVTSFNAIIRSI
ncbi:MAG: triose-phosphate isomerase [Candidatus Buchananbacteria bacterium RBG_13_36_9]|uniref:Triosephosphate isomerase n=1 Tax=Candidatus Buchananbacteria bacterium RBG_13_36_9 TaxID=1797530 RepID=A0A1G1XM37_9BACT|nr:MAG: triose-phosphate isomerase [Candidatus Buchananbacteria bacterium RBG_13_36_9]